MTHKTQQKTGQNGRPKVNNVSSETNKAYSKVSRANSTVNKANAQSAERILFAQANGKLYFALLTSFSAAQNHLPRHGEDSLRSRKSFQRIITKIRRI
jgi:hypothetical protein